MSHRWTAVATLTVLLALEGRADAIQTLKLPLIDGLACDVSVYSGFQAAIYLPEPAVHVNAGDHAGFQITVENRGMRYLVQPINWPPSTNINLRTASSTVSLHLKMTPSTDKAVTVIQFTDPDEWENPHAIVQTLCGISTAANYLDLALMDARRDEVSFSPGFTETVIRGGHTMTLTTGPLHRSSSRLSFRFMLENAGERAYPLQGMSISDRETDNQYLRCWRAALLREDERRTSAPITVCNGTSPAPIMLRPGERIEGEVTAERPWQLQAGFVLQLHARPGVTQIAFAWTDTVKPAPRPPHNLRRIAIGVMGGGGAIRLDSGAVEGGWTSNQSLGVRASYTPLAWLSVDGSLEALRTGVGPLGQDEASLSGGRFQAQARVQVGERFVPYFRAGVGVFVGSLSRTSAESEFRFGNIWGFGVGANMWIGERLVVGIDASYLDGEFLSAELGVHIGYSFRR